MSLAVGVLVGCRTGLAEIPAVNNAGDTPPAPKTVNVITRREGETTRFFVENLEFGEITMTFELGMVNLKGNVTFPYTAVFPPRHTTEAFTVAPVEAEAKWSYSYTNYYKLGSNCVRHDDSCVYELPYLAGMERKVTQAYNGKFSHKGSNQYAIDWQMPEGSLVPNSERYILGPAASRFRGHGHRSRERFPV
jgi:hypothetical protein